MVERTPNEHIQDQVDFFANSRDGTGSIPGFNIPEFDYLGVAYPNSTTETYTYKTGGSGGTTVATITVVYTDATKANLSSATKS